MDQPNYLGHPSPYYLFISLFLDRTLPPDRAILLPRLASTALVLAGVVLALLAGRRHFRRDLPAAPVFYLLLALCPKLLAVSGQVTNDSLAFLGGGLAYWGVTILDRRRWSGMAGVALGLTFALWSKPNGGLLVGGFLGFFFLLRMPRRTGLLLAIAGGAILGSVPYWFMLRDYGVLVPVTVEQFGTARQLSGFSSFVPAFLANIGYTFSFAHTAKWPMPTWGGILASALFWMMMACVAFGGLMAFARGRTTRDAITIAAPLAFAVVLPIHFWFSATKLGFSLPAASFRYYLPLWPTLAHALAYGTLAPRRRGVLLAGAALGTLAIGWLSP
jgi:hypothetical protein